MKYLLDFTTDYHQFYLSDKDSPHDTGSEKFRTEQSHADKLAVEDGIPG